MKAPANSDRAIHAAARLYILSRAIKALPVLAMIGLAVLMVIGAIALSTLRHLGA